MDTLKKIKSYLPHQCSRNIVSSYANHYESDGTFKKYLQMKYELCRIFVTDKIKNAWTKFITWYLVFASNVGAIWAHAVILLNISTGQRMAATQAN